MQTRPKATKMLMSNSNNMLKEIIDKFYLDKEQDRDRHHFYVTDAGKCPRSIFYKFKNAPAEKMEANILRLLDHGDYIQMHILSNLFSLGIVRASEVRIPPQEMISGRADAVITLENELYVIDVKGINSNTFKPLNEPKPDNVNQIQLYLHYFQIPRGILLYVNKNTLELKEFFVPYEKDYCEKLIADLKVLKEKIDKNIIPSRIGEYPFDYQCRYCQFKEVCRMSGPNEIEWVEFRKKIETA